MQIPKKSLNRRPWKIVSGGQTGVDRAALVAAMTFSIPSGGWVPKGRLAEDGVVPEDFYGLKECQDGSYRERTRLNVRDSDATLILADALPLTGGTAYTARYAERTWKPCKVVRLGDDAAIAQIRDWMLSLEDTVRPGQSDMVVLNVAGPRESGSPGIFARAKQALIAALSFFRNYSGGDIYSIGDDGFPLACIDAEYVDIFF